MESNQSIWKNKSYVWLISGQTLCEFGSAVQLFVLPWLMLKMTGSATQMAISMAVGFLPYLLLSLPFGAYVDRYDRKTLMMIANVGRLIGIASLPVGVYLWDFQVWHLLLVQGFMSAMASLFDAAYMACLPHVVKKEQLAQANGALQMGISVSQLSGPALAGVLVYAIGVSGTLVLSAASYLISVLSLRMIPISFRSEQIETAGPRVSLVQQIGEGLKYVWNQKLIRVLTIFAMLINLSAMSMGPAVIFRVENELLQDSYMLGLVLSGWGIGTVTGSFLAGMIMKRMKMGAVMLISLSFQMLTPLLFLAAGNPIIMALSYAIFGVAIGIWNVQSITLRQSIIPNNLLGRAGSSIRILSWGSIPVGQIIGGTLSDQYGSASVFIVTGAIQVFLCIWALAGQPFRERSEDCAKGTLVESV